MGFSFTASIMTIHHCLFWSMRLVMTDSQSYAELRRRLPKCKLINSPRATVGDLAAKAHMCNKTVTSSAIACSDCAAASPTHTAQLSLRSLSMCSRRTEVNEQIRALKLTLL